MDAYPFTDPLSPPGSARLRQRIRRVHAVVYGAAAVSLGLAALTDGGPVEQRLFAAGAMAMTAAVAALMLLWRGAGDRVLLAAFPLAAATVSFVAVLDPPLALTPMFYIWPLMTAAYFLRRREALLTYVAVCSSFGIVLPWVVTDSPRVILWFTVAIVGAVVMAFAIKLKERLERLVTRLGRLAREDPLTGALNRRAFLEHLDAQAARGDRADQPLATVVLDVDHFKAINDRLGHAAGDDALRLLVATIRQRLRHGDALGRLGGEEFAVALADADLDGALAYAEDLRRRVANASAASGVPFTVSVGVATTTHGPRAAEALIAAADSALYAAKRTGRDTVRAATRLAPASAATR
jgi:diguanylate cyclase (GGDEF)-like protein